MHIFITTLGSSEYSTSVGRSYYYVVGVPSSSDEVIVSVVVVEVAPDLGDILGLLPAFLTDSPVIGAASPASRAATLTVSAVGCAAFVDSAIAAAVSRIAPRSLKARA